MAQIQLFVNPNLGDDSHSGTAAQPFKTITAALKQAQAATIQLTAAKYTQKTGEQFPLIVPSGVTILGDETNQGEKVIIRGSGIFHSDRLKAQKVSLVLESGSALRGVTVSNPEPKGSGIWLEDSTAVIENNRLQRCGREAIFACGKSKPVILDNLFLNNVGNGIFLVNHTKGEICHNRFAGNKYAIAVNEFASPLIAHNHIAQNQVGLFLAKQSCPVLRRNIIEANREAGVVVSGSSQPDFGSQQDSAGNMIRANGEADLRNKSGLVVVSVGNDLDGATTAGMVEFLASEVAAIHHGIAPFRDVADHWAEPFIQVLVAEGFLQGFADGSFQPDTPVTRGEYAICLAKCFDLPRPLGVADGQFLDIPDDLEGAQAIAKTVSMGFLGGYPDDTFRPQAPLTRLQVILSLAKGLGLKEGNPKVLQAFQDRPEIPSDALKAIAAATQNSLVVNYPKNNRLQPSRKITRGEMAALLHQALVLQQKLPILDSEFIVNPLPYLPSFTDVIDHWAKPFISAIANLGLIKGYPDGSFQPDQPLNRAEFATLISDIFVPLPVRPAGSFFDVPEGFGAAKAIQEAYRGGFLSDFPDQTFHPQQSLKRVHVLLAIAQGLSLPCEDLTILERYEDVAEIPSYAHKAVAATTTAGIVVNYPNRNFLKANAIATRAETVAFCYQALVYLGRATPIDSEAIVDI